MTGEMENSTCFNWAKLCSSVGPCLRPGGTLLTDRALELCNLPAGSRIVDVGCGAGGTLEHLERAGFRHLVGLDHSGPLLTEAGARLEAARLIRGEAHAIPFGNGSFDLLLCECVLSVLPDRSAALREFARVVREGGYLVLSDVFGKDGDKAAGRADGPLAREELLDAVEESGFALLHWESHDRLLKEFAVRMILAGACLPDAWGGDRRREGRQNGYPGIGYFLLVARLRQGVGG